LLLVIR
jgi:hypothetical protein